MEIRGNAGADIAPSGSSRRVLKKYPGCRLYQTRSRSNITLADVKGMRLGGQPFEVRGAKCGEDLTRTAVSTATRHRARRAHGSRRT